MVHQQPCVGSAIASTHDSSGRMTKLHADHARPLLRFLLRLTRGDSQTAEDLLQETMLRAWRHIDSLPTEPDRTRRWLFTVARRLAIDTFRMRQVRPVEVSLTDAHTMKTADDSIAMAMAAHSVCHAYTQLSSAHRHILAELYFQGRTTDETAARLGLPVGTVKSRAHYALRSLHAVLDETE
jgi:RNA polymerase sigma-70 factor (ECF subfamily)